MPIFPKLYGHDEVLSRVQDSLIALEERLEELERELQINTSSIESLATRVQALENP